MSDQKVRVRRAASPSVAATYGQPVGHRQEIVRAARAAGTHTRHGELVALLTRSTVRHTATPMPSSPTPSRRTPEPALAGAGDDG